MNPFIQMTPGQSKETNKRKSIPSYLIIWSRKCNKRDALLKAVNSYLWNLRQPSQSRKLMNNEPRVPHNKYSFKLGINSNASAVLGNWCTNPYILSLISLETTADLTGLNDLLYWSLQGESEAYTQFFSPLFDLEGCVEFNARTSHDISGLWWGLAKGAARTPRGGRCTVTAFTSPWKRATPRGEMVQILAPIG